MNNGIQNDLSFIFTSLLKPLSFASKDDFLHIEAVKGIELLVSNLCSKAVSYDLSKDIEREFEVLEGLFCNYDDLDDVQKRARISMAMELIEEIRARSSQISLSEAKNKIEILMTPLKDVKGLGPRLAERFGKKGLKNIEDIFYFFPIRYEDRRNIKRISKVEIGKSEVVVGEILVLGEVFYGRRKVFEMSIGDETGILRAKWFNYRIPYFKRRYKAGQRLLLFGEVSSYAGQREIIHPDIEPIESGKEDLDDLKTIVPIYSQIDNLHQKTMRKIVKRIVEDYAEYAVGGVPDFILKRYNLMDLPGALRTMHVIDKTDTVDSINRLPKKSIVFDEFFCLESGIAQRKAGLGKESGMSFNTDAKVVQKLLENMPFSLTKAQERVIEEIKDDMSSPHPMNRLLQGDVGSGKTIVALISALIAIDNGFQAALMVPTEILAEQHYLTSHRYLDPIGINVALLTGSLSKCERNAMKKDVKRGGIDFVIGTHAIIQEDLEFKNLGFVIVDEQHRFGVTQRASLKKKGGNPDILVMTATPIPRTLEMTVFGDLDVSTIDELPPGRQQVDTKVFREGDRNKIYSIIKEELQNGRQAYIVYPLVEESQELELNDATNMKEKLQRDVFVNYRVGLLHGRMKGEEKESIMRGFKERKIDVLVATTVIEVGIDIPNATVMLV